MSEIVTCMVLIGILILGSVTDLHAQSWEDDPNQHVMVDMRMRLYRGNRIFGSYRPHATRLLSMLPDYTPDLPNGSNKGFLSIRYEPFVDLVDKAKEINAQIYPLTSYFDGRTSKN